MFEIGNSLREARLRRELELRDAEHGTKIRGKYLRALEDERFELLPAHTYVKGFLRAYADYLGLDGQLYVDEYNSRYVIGEEDAPLRAAARPGRQAPAGRTARVARRAARARRDRARDVPRDRRVALRRPRGAARPRTTRGATPAWSRCRSRRERPASSCERRAATPTWSCKLRSAIGTVLYQGTLERGQQQRFEGKVLWVRLESPANVLVKVNGNRKKLRPPSRRRARS